MSMFQSNRPDKKCKLLEVDLKIIPKRNLADLSTHYDLHLISCNLRILKVFEKLFPRKWSLVCPAKAKKRRRRKGVIEMLKSRLQCHFSPQNYLDILLNLHRDRLCKLICSIKNRWLHNAHFINSILGSLGLFWPDSDQKLTQLVWNGVFGQKF